MGEPLMNNDNNNGTCAAAVKTFVRNRYFYGKLLDVLHFELEQNYFNSKRWLINRLVLGYGVVCGLDLKVGPDQASVIVQPGIAIDKGGREVIVPIDSQPVPLPQLPPTPLSGECPDDANCFNLVLCYHECQGDPSPAMGGDCDQNALCSPGSIRERYELHFRQGKLAEPSTDCPVGDLVAGNRINYQALAQYVSAPCPDCPEDPCIPLANVHVPAGGAPLTIDNIDIGVRYVVFTLDLLHDLMVCLTNKTAAEHVRGGKS
ncbi:MAG TPA: hypothetical protein VGH38_32900 [Bryobacteraceae bacterium]|jgi:hypothetical protein